MQNTKLPKGLLIQARAVLNTKSCDIPSKCDTQPLLCMLLNMIFASVLWVKTRIQGGELNAGGSESLRQLLQKGMEMMIAGIVKRDRKVVESRGFCIQGRMAILGGLFVRTVRVEVNVGNVLRQDVGVEVRASDNCRIVCP